MWSASGRDGHRPLVLHLGADRAWVLSGSTAVCRGTWQIERCAMQRGAGEGTEGSVP